MEFNLLSTELLDTYIKSLEFSPLEKLSKIEKPDLLVDYFQFYKSVSLFVNRYCLASNV